MSIHTFNSQQLLPSILDDRARNDPQGVWSKFPASATTYSFGFKKATNSEVANAVNTVAWALKEQLGSIQDFPTIAYLGPNDLRYYVVILAAMKVGCKAFLPSPRNSNVAHLDLLSRLDCKFLVTPSPVPTFVPQILEEYSMQQAYIPSVEKLLSARTVPHYPYNKTYEEAKEEPILVLHTSGSTGIPKPLIYTNEFVTRFANALAVQAPDGYESLLEKTQSGSFLSFLPPFHIAGVCFSLFVPSFFQSVPVYPLPGKPPSVGGFLEAVEHADFDWAFLLPVILDELSRDSSALNLVRSKLQYLYYTGGSLPQAAGEVLSQSLPVYPCMGSSEIAGLPLVHPKDATSTEVWMYIQPHASANVEFRHRYGDAYELVIVKSPETEHCQPVFTHFPQLVEYATRDLFTRHPSRPNAFRHQGRIDDIIVFINGEKTNPVTFEQEVGRHPEVRSALVVGSQRFEACLLIELLDPSTYAAGEQGKVIERIWPVVKDANKTCPSHARVSKARILLADPAMPMLRAGKGTVQRQGTLDLYSSRIDEMYAAGDEAFSGCEGKKGVDSSNIATVTDAVRRCVAYITDWVEFDEEDDFFFLGMDSLQVLQLSRELKNMLSLTEAAPSMIYKSPSVALLANNIFRTQGDALPDGNSEQDRPHRMDSVLLEYKSKIDEFAGNHTGTDHSIERPESEVVVLTGSTGAVGSYLLQELLQNPAVSHVYCLNRSQDSETIQKARNAERGIAHPLPPSRVTFLTTDLRGRNLGIDKAIYDTMVSTTTQIIHNAWPVNFNQSLQSFRPSLDQLLSLVSFAARAKFDPSLFFLSSISAVINYHMVPDAEALVPELAIDSLSCPPAIGYGESKFIGERILDYAAMKLDIKTGAARVGQVAGPAKDPWGWNRNEWFPSLVITSRSLGALPLSLGAFEDSSRDGGPMDSVDWVPIDQLAPVLVELSSSLSITNLTPGLRIFHPLNPLPRDWKSLIPAVARALEASIATAVGSDNGVEPRIRLVDYSEWLEMLRSKLTSLDDDSRKQLLEDFPAIKLFDFFEETLLIKGTDQDTRPLAMGKALEASPSLRSLEAIQEEWMEGWVRAWMS